MWLLRCLLCCCVTALQDKTVLSGCGCAAVRAVHRVEVTWLHQAGAQPQNWNQSSYLHNWQLSISFGPDGGPDRREDDWECEAARRAGYRYRFCAGGPRRGEARPGPGQRGQRHRGLLGPRHRSRAHQVCFSTSSYTTALHCSTVFFLKNKYWSVQELRSTSILFRYIWDSWALLCYHLNHKC